MGITYREGDVHGGKGTPSNIACHHCLPANWGPSAPPTKILYFYRVPKQRTSSLWFTCFNYQKLVPTWSEWLFLRTFALRYLPLGNFWMFFEPQAPNPTPLPSAFSSQVTAERLSLTVWMTRVSCLQSFVSAWKFPFTCPEAVNEH